MRATSIDSPETRINPVSRANKAVEIAKNADGSMTVTRGDGATFTIPASGKEMQAFVVWTMLHKDATEL